MWGSGLRGNNAAFSALCRLSVTSSATHKQIGPSDADSWVDEFVYVLGPCGSLQWTLLWGWEFLPLPQPPQVFTAKGFEALFPHAGTLSCTVCLAPQLFLPVFPEANVGLPSLPATALPQVLSTKLPVSTLPTSLDEGFFFNSLVVRHPYSLIFWQFWLFFVFKFFVVLLWIVLGLTVYLPTPQSWLEVWDVWCYQEIFGGKDIVFIDAKGFRHYTTKHCYYFNRLSSIYLVLEHWNNSD